jgi:PadR family transcriptional regulator PadR
VYSIGVSNKEPSNADVLQGTLDIMILQTFATLGVAHGCAVAARLEQVSGGSVQLNVGKRGHPLSGTDAARAARLHQRHVGVTDNKRRARVYAIIAASRRRLAVQKQEWNRTVATRQALLSESS